MPLEQDVSDMGHQLEKLVGEGKAVSFEIFHYTVYILNIC